MKIHPDCERLMFTEEQLRTRVREIAEQVDKVFADKRPLVVGILKGSIIFYADFIRFLTMPVELDFMAVSSYGAGAVSSGKLNIKKDLDRDVKGRDVIIVEDIIDSGFTLANLKALLTERGASSVTIVTLLNKAERREYETAPDYNCFDIENEFVIGYGLDYNEQYRHLPYIGILKRSVYEK
ncbi:MAG: hypoxanthine phosphoribosyltransferase [Clostridia bacterium]|jgi:hypoxanthine phosphoribosyltransferase|nr:hypoxanthine phosphoribosyltransferase [Clostridia bacterium]